MKNFLITISVLSGLLATSPAYSLIMGGVEVGGADTVEAYNIDNLSGYSGGDAGEIEWVNFELGTTYTSLYKPADSTSWIGYDEFFSATTEKSLIDYMVFSLDQGPGHYIMKNNNSRVLLTNIAEIDYGLVAVSDLPADFWGTFGNDFIISHVSEFGGSATVPEPSILALMGFGILGLGLSRRRMKK